MNDAMGQTTPPPAAAGTVYFNLDDDEVPAAGVRPPPLAEVRPQWKVGLWHKGCDIWHEGPNIWQRREFLEVPVLQRDVGADDVLNDRATLLLLQGLATPPVPPSGKRRKRKKRREKKKLPKTSSSWFSSPRVRVRYPDRTKGLDGGAGDQGNKFRYVADGTEEAMPLSHSRATRSTEVRMRGKLWWLWPDGETQVTKEYGQRADVSVEPRVSTPVSSPLSRLSPWSLSSARRLRGIPCMERMNRFSTEKVLRKTLGEIIPKNGHPAWCLYGELDEHVHRGEGSQEDPWEIILKNGQRSLNLYGDRTYLYIQHSGSILGSPQGEAGSTGRCSWSPRRYGKVAHFASFFGLFRYFFGALDGTQFLLCVVEGREVALTPGVELPGVGPPGAGVSAQALAP